MTTKPTDATAPYFQIIQDSLEELKVHTTELAAADTVEAKAQKSQQFHDKFRAIQRKMVFLLTTVQEEHEVVLLEEVQERIDAISKEVASPTDK